MILNLSEKKKEYAGISPRNLCGRQHTEYDCKNTAAHNDGEPAFDVKENAMKKLKTILGYTAAVLAMFVVIATFMGNHYFSHKLVSATGIKVSPWYTGGEIVKVVEYETYRSLIHRPVFDGLISERQEGFIQINWESRTGMPPVLRETVDYDGDNKADFLVTLDTATGATSHTGYNPAVASVLKTYKLEKGWAVRIKLKKIY